MLEGLAMQEAYVEYDDKAVATEVKQAYRYMIGWAATLKNHVCFPSGHGHIKDFRFMRGEDWDFSFIPNQKWLLFYFRTPCLRLSKYTRAAILNCFPGAKETSAGEFTIRVARLDDAVRIASFVER